MNLGGILSGVSGVLKNIGPAFTGLFNLGRYVLNKDYRKSVDQSGLTTTQKEMNQFSDEQREAQNRFEADQVDLAYERQMDADNTKYQRAVADMRAAGINPMMAVSNGVSGPSIQAGSAGAAPSAASGGVAQNLSGLMDLVRLQQEYKLRQRELDLQKEQIDINKSATEVDNALKRQQQEESAGRLSGIQLDNAIKAESFDAEIEERRLRPALTRSKIREIDGMTDRLAAETDDAKARAILHNASAYQLLALLPYQQKLMSAQEAESRQAVVYSAVCTAYQQGLIDSGYIESLVREANASASVAEVNQAVQEIEYALRTGKFSGTGIDTGVSWLNSVLGTLSSVTTNVLGVLQPIGSVVGLNFHKPIETSTPRNPIGFK